MSHLLQIETAGAGLYEFTDQLHQFVDQGRHLHLFVRHTSCSLLIQENADPDVQADLQAFFKRLVPPSDDPKMAYLKHVMEGPDDMPAHIKAAMMPVCLTIPIVGGELALGTWQGVYLFEHRARPHKRQIICSVS